MEFAVLRHMGQGFAARNEYRAKRSPPSIDSNKKACSAELATRRNAPVGVCKSAKTLRTTGTTLPFFVAAKNSSKVFGFNSSIEN